MTPAHPAFPPASHQASRPPEIRPQPLQSSSPLPPLPTPRAHLPRFHPPSFPCIQLPQHKTLPVPHTQLTHSRASRAQPGRLRKRPCDILPYPATPYVPAVVATRAGGWAGWTVLRAASRGRLQRRNAGMCAALAKRPIRDRCVAL